MRSARCCWFSAWWAARGRDCIRGGWTCARSTRTEAWLNVQSGPGRTLALCAALGLPAPDLLGLPAPDATLRRMS